MPQVTAPPHPDTAYRLDSPSGLGAAWQAFRAGETVACVRCGGSLSLSVDAPSSTYRLGCVRCGLASRWFESGLSGLVLRTTSVPPPR